MSIAAKAMPNERSNLSGRVADAELPFTDGEFEALTLIGFGGWQRRPGSGLTLTSQRISPTTT